MEWVSLRPILEVCNRWTGYKVGGRHREMWWRQMAAWKQLIETLGDIIKVVRALRRESGRRGEVRGGGEVPDSDSLREGPRYAGTHTGDYRVGKLSCVGKI